MRPVDVVQGDFQPPRRGGEIELAVPCAEQFARLFVGGGCVRGGRLLCLQRGAGRREGAADPIPEFRGGRAGKRDDEDAVERPLFLHDEPGDDGGERVRLAGAGTRLDERGAGVPQREIESGRGGVGLRTHRSAPTVGGTGRSPLRSPTLTRVREGDYPRSVFDDAESEDSKAVMISVSADTLSTARRLQNEFGMDQRASEGVAIAIHEHLIQNVATKDDLALLQAELEKRIIATKDDLALTQAELEKQIIATKNDLALTQAELEKQIIATRDSLALTQAELEKQIIATRDSLTLTQAEMEKQIIATRDSLTLTQAEMEKQIEAVRGELKQDVAAVRQEVAGVRVELHREIAETNRRIDALHTEFTNEFKVLYRHLWGMGAGIIAVMVALLKLL